MISSLLHLVGLRPRVYYTLTNFRGGGARPPWPPPQYANAFGDKQALIIEFVFLLIPPKKSKMQLRSYEVAHKKKEYATDIIFTLLL